MRTRLSGDLETPRPYDLAVIPVRTAQAVVRSVRDAQS